MPTTSRIDYGWAVNEGPNGKMQSGPSFKSYGSGQIVQQVLENRIDAKVAEIAGVRHPHRCRINYYGDQCQAGSIAIVFSSNNKPVRVTIAQEMIDEAKAQTTSGA